MARHPDAEGRVIEILSERAPGRNVPARRSEDGGQTWSVHYELPAALEGSGHRVATLPDGRIAVSFRDLHPESPTRGDLVVWVGRFEDLAAAREGDFTARLLALEGWQPADGNRQLEVDAQGDLVARGCWRLEEGQEPRPVVLRISVADILDRVPRRAHRLPLIDLDGDAARRVVVDREKGQYLGHVTTVLLEDGRTILAVYPKGHGKGEIVSKRSTDGGRTWSDRLPTPDNWATSREVPTIHRVVDPQTGKDRLILWSGLHPARLAVSEDEGASWSPLRKVGDWGGIVVMGFVERLKDGRYLAMFHDDGRYFGAEPAAKSPVEFSLYKTFSDDGGLSWSSPEVVWRGSEVHLCEPGCLRSPDGTTLAVLLRENRRRRNSYVIFSQDEGQSFSAPRELPASLTGDRHTGRYAPDGRLFISFRDTTLESPTQGDWVGWVGRWDDIRDGCEGQYRVRLADNQHRWDTAYPGVECLPDGTIVTTTYGHWEAGESPYILSLRFSLGELDRLAKDGADR
ncbi:MAG: exo-alpha-sialidase [Planctomycetes bacterium]|nr:exo-alpha-sialidase [Planctomycetota bacterium]